MFFKRPMHPLRPFCVVIKKEGEDEIYCGNKAFKTLFQQSWFKVGVFVSSVMNLCCG